jgi:hypothetical protein
MSCASADWSDSSITLGVFAPARPPASRCRGGKNLPASRSCRRPHRPSPALRRRCLPVAVTLSTRPPMATSWPSFCAGAGVENLDPAGRGSTKPGSEPFFGARIAVCGHDNGQGRDRRASAPRLCANWPSAAPFNSTRRSSFRRIIRYLAFGIAEAGIVFDQLRPVCGDHQPGEQHAGERRAARPCHASSAR